MCDVCAPTNADVVRRQRSAASLIDLGARRPGQKIKGTGGAAPTRTSSRTSDHERETFRSEDLVIPASIGLRTLEANSEELKEKLAIRESGTTILIIQGPALREQSDANYLFILVFLCIAACC